MDALPVRELSGLPYASSVRATAADGTEVPVMHACGHDVHVTCLLGAADLFAGATAQWSGTVVAVFQPAEEVADGARGIVDDGLATLVGPVDVAAITVLDAAGLSLFAVTGASKASALGLGAVQAIILGVITGVGGGTVRDALTQQVPTVLRSELYAIPALLGATITILTIRTGLYGLPAALGAAVVCFVTRMVGVRFGLNAPRPPGRGT
jgi:uncharacterized membrane protein YeaQ/YmgE (transglycosylase-associated protein family)